MSRDSDAVAAEGATPVDGEAAGVGAAAARRGGEEVGDDEGADDDGNEEEGGAAPCASEDGVALE